MSEDLFQTSESHIVFIFCKGYNTIADLWSWMLKRVIINFEFVMLKFNCRGLKRTVNNNLIETAYKYRSRGLCVLLVFLVLE
jgi:hypothetical protein